MLPDQPVDLSRHELSLCGDSLKHLEARVKRLAVEGSKKNTMGKKSEKLKTAQSLLDDTSRGPRVNGKAKTANKEYEAEIFKNHQHLELVEGSASSGAPAPCLL